MVDELQYEGVSSGNYQGMKLLQPMYIGGVPNFGSISRKSGSRAGFVGRYSNISDCKG